MDPLEAVADAIMAYEGWKPGSVSNRNRNPGNLRESAYATGHDLKGYATFNQLVTGYTALLVDLHGKFSGDNEHHLNGESRLLEMMEVYAPAADHNVPLAYAQFIAHWLTLALSREIHTWTTLREIAPEVAGPILVPDQEVSG